MDGSPRSWKLIHIDKIIVIAGTIGLVTTVWEKNAGVGNLVSNLEKIWQLNMDGFHAEFVKLVKFLLAFVILMKTLTKELYVACYLVMLYAYVSGNKQIVMPWIVVSAFRSLFVEAVACFVGCVICSHYYTVKYICLDYVINKGFNMACSACLWSIVYESYMAQFLTNRRGIALSTNAAAQGRSLESVLAEAVVDWFLEEAERCRKFDSKLAVDEDIIKFEQGISLRAARFLELKPEEVVEDVKMRLEKGKPVIRKHLSTQTDDKDGIVEINQEDKSESSEGIQNISEYDMEMKNPLRRFPYIPIIGPETISQESSEFNNDTVLGNKCVSVQTFESFYSLSETTTFYDL